MSTFEFRGEVPPSKSILNRALIIQSFQPSVRLVGDSHADDVQLMRSALWQLENKSGEPSIECGDAGTVLRFLALRISRQPGVHILSGSERLFARPQSELIPILNQLSVDAEIGKNSVKIRSQGWRLAVDGLHINAERSSQFASAVVLSAWDLPFALPFLVSKKMVSEGYFRMTLQMARDFGMRIQERGSEFMIPPRQKISRQLVYEIEPDLSSAFAIAALAVVGGHAEIKKIPRRSLQPDGIFVSLLQQMGADIRHEGGALIVNKSRLINGVHADLTNSPDLFPVLAVLCAVAGGQSEFTGISHLRFKESSRLERTIELITWMGARVDGDESKVTIYPCRTRPVGETKRIFDPDHDHRMAMAAQVAQWAGFPIQVGDMKVVAKSFPEFAQIAASQNNGSSSGDSL